MKIFGKGSQKYATEVLYVKSNKLYFDADTTKEVKRADVKKLMPSQVVIASATAYDAVTSILIDGSKVVVGSTEYSVAE